ncbi:MAG: phosphatase PAP2 family protein [Thermoplasmatales archaeon]|nr:phosphatase PAP2 family protein [Thermoplasmatales archaeon]
MLIVKALLWYISLLLVLMCIGILIFDEERKISRKTCYRRVKDGMGYLIILIFVMVMIKIENILQDNFSIGRDFTPLIYGIEGTSHIVFLQNLINNNFFIHFVSVFYLVSFMYVIIFTPIIFILRGEENFAKISTYAILINYLVLVPFYLFFNVSVTSSYPEVKPILYSNPNYMSLVLLADRLTDNFPSGHISVLVPLSLIVFSHPNMKRYKILVFFTTIFMPFVILYLGIHWLMDIFSGLILGISSYFIAKNEKASKFFDKIIGKF